VRWFWEAEKVGRVGADYLVTRPLDHFFAVGYPEQYILCHISCILGTHIAPKQINWPYKQPPKQSTLYKSALANHKKVAMTTEVHNPRNKTPTPSPPSQHNIRPESNSQHGSIALGGQLYDTLDETRGQLTRRRRENRQGSQTWYDHCPWQRWSCLGRCTGPFLILWVSYFRKGLGSRDSYEEWPIAGVSAYRVGLDPNFAASCRRQDESHDGQEGYDDGVVLHFDGLFLGWELDVFVVLRDRSFV